MEKFYLGANGHYYYARIDLHDASIFLILVVAMMLMRIFNRAADRAIIKSTHLKRAKLMRELTIIALLAQGFLIIVDPYTGGRFAQMYQQ